MTPVKRNLSTLRFYASAESHRRSVRCLTHLDQVWAIILVLGTVIAASATCGPTVVSGSLLEQAQDGSQSLAFAGNGNEFSLPPSASVASLRQPIAQHAALQQRIPGCHEISLLKANLVLSIKSDPLGYAAQRSLNPNVVPASGSPTLFSLGMLLRL